MSKQMKDSKRENAPCTKFRVSNSILEVTETAGDAITALDSNNRVWQFNIDRELSTDGICPEIGGMLVIFDCGSDYMICEYVFTGSENATAFLELDPVFHANLFRSGVADRYDANDEPIGPCACETCQWEVYPIWAGVLDDCYEEVALDPDLEEEYDCEAYAEYLAEMYEYCGEECYWGECCHDENGEDCDQIPESTRQQLLEQLTTPRVSLGIPF